MFFVRVLAGDVFMWLLTWFAKYIVVSVWRLTCVCSEAYVLLAASFATLYYIAFILYMP